MEYEKENVKNEENFNNNNKRTVNLVSKLFKKMQPKFIFI